MHQFPDERFDDNVLRDALRLEEEGRLTDALSRFQDAISQLRGEGPDTGERVAFALVRQCLLYSRLGQPDSALARYETVVARFSGADDARVRENVAWALNNKALILYERGAVEQAISVNRELIDLFRDGEDLELQRRVAAALEANHRWLWDSKRYDEALRTVDEVIDWFGGASDEELQARIATAMWQKGDILSDLGRVIDAIAAYDRLAQDFAAYEGVLEFRRYVAGGMSNKVVLLADHGQPELAISAAEDVIRRFGESHGVFDFVAHAMLYKGIALERAGFATEAIAAYQALLSRVEASAERAEEKVVQYARKRLRSLARNRRGAE